VQTQPSGSYPTIDKDNPEECDNNETLISSIDAALSARQSFSAAALLALKRFE
jgi:hypothetical protein